MRVLYCDVDTLRADHTGPYGYGRTVTPNLDRLAGESVVLERCYASDSPCAPSRAAWTSGQFGITTGAIGNVGPAADIRLFERTRHAPFFGGHLYRNGVPTASISAFPERHMAYWYTGNFRQWVKPSLSNGDDEDAATVTAVAVDWLRRHALEDSWLLQVHFWEPHTPYIVSADWVERARRAGDPPGWPDDDAVAAHADCYGPHSALDLYEGDGTWSVPPPRSPNPVAMPDAIRTRADAVALLDGYDATILYWDHHLGILLQELADIGVLDETAVIVTSDHGEALGENGCYGDHPMANEPTHHVPMVIRWPGHTDRLHDDRRRVGGLVYQLDLCPTLCDLLDIPVPPGWEGESFAAAVRGEPFDGRGSLVLSHGAYTSQRAVRTPDHLYVETLHPGLWRLPWRQLYAIEDDPHMTVDLVDAEPAVVSDLAGRLAEWREAHLTLPGPTPDPMEQGRYEGPTHAFAVDRYLGRLRATGRAHLADDLQRRLAEPWVTAGRWTGSADDH